MIDTIVCRGTLVRLSNENIDFLSRVAAGGLFFDDPSSLIKMGGLAPHAVDEDDEVDGGAVGWEEADEEVSEEDADVVGE